MVISLTNRGAGHKLAPRISFFERNDMQADQPQANHSYNGTSYTLEQTLLRSISFWATKVIKSNGTLVWDRERDSMVEADHPFYPSTQDLIQDVWVKVLSKWPAIENVWNDPHPRKGGFIGVSKLISVLVTRMMIDGKRYRDRRAKEILAVNIDDTFEITNDEGVTEDEGTQADLIADEIDQPQAFRFDDLRGELSEAEFDVLYESIVNGAKLKELAQERHESATQVQATAGFAKFKARKWVAWLRQCSYKQARAHICYTFERKPCLRPDRIAAENVQGWNALRVVPFRDPACQWRPAITNQPRVTAKRECINSACHNGLAIGADNLVLPASRRHEAVRFLPARTEKAGMKCAGCKALEQAAQMRPKVRAAASVSLQQTAPQHLEKEKNNMSHKEIAEIIKTYAIPRSTVARIAGLHLSDFSGWLNGRADLSDDKIERITQVTNDISQVVEHMAPIPIDLRNIESIKELIRVKNDGEMQMRLFEEAQELAQTDLPQMDFRIRPINVVSAD